MDAKPRDTPDYLSISLPLFFSHHSPSPLLPPLSPPSISPLLPSLPPPSLSPLSSLTPPSLPPSLPSSGRLEARLVAKRSDARVVFFPPPIFFNKFLSSVAAPLFALQPQV